MDTFKEIFEDFKVPEMSGLPLLDFDSMTLPSNSPFSPNLLGDSSLPFDNTSDLQPLATSDLFYGMHYSPQPAAEGHSSSQAPWRQHAPSYGPANNELRLSLAEISSRLGNLEQALLENTERVNKILYSLDKLSETLNCSMTGLMAAVGSVKDGVMTFTKGLLGHFFGSESEQSASSDQ